MRFTVPSKKTVLKWALGVVGTLLLSALGSGVWQSLLGPAMHASTRWLLDLASLGLTSYKNSVYQQIAADNQSRTAVETLNQVTIIYVMISTAATVYAFFLNYSTGERGQRLLTRLSEAPPDPQPATTVDAMRQELATVLKSTARIRWALYVCSLMLGFVFVNHFVMLARVSYINSADAHYHQVLRVASPYLDAREQAQVESDFAQVGSREDYVRLLSRLEGQCKAQGRTVPKFDPW